MHSIISNMWLLQNIHFQKKIPERKQHQRVEHSQEVFKTQRPHSEIGPHN